MSYEIGVVITAIILITTSIGGPDKEKQQKHEEEEKMEYSEEGLQNDWEFKIVHADMGSNFQKPEKLKKLLDEEQRAGWILLEKLDDSRVRFKRRRSAQTNDAQLISDGIDPYRTTYTPPGNIAVMRGLVVMALVFLFVVLFIFIVRPF